jgi:hypothetical protein
MKEPTSLKMAIISWGIIGLLGIPLLVFLDPFGGWRWEPHNSIYDQMIVSIYMVLGIFCFLSLRNPLKHSSFLWFVVWSSVAHGSVMLFHAIHADTHSGHLLGDVWILLGAIALAIPLWQAQRKSNS